MTTTNIGGYRITERATGNGWYELSTLAYSMGEEYREHKRYNYKPTKEDYTRFVQEVESHK